MKWRTPKEFRDLDKTKYGDTITAALEYYSRFSRRGLKRVRLRHREIVIDYLLARNTKTMQDTAEKYKLSLERIRQICQKFVWRCEQKYHALQDIR